MFRDLMKGSKAPLILIFAYLFIFSITLTRLHSITSANLDDFPIKDNLDQINPVNQFSNLLEDLISFPYTPVTNLSGSGNNFDVEDILTVYDDFSLNLTYNSLTGYFEENNLPAVVKFTTPYTNGIQSYVDMLPEGLAGTYIAITLENNQQYLAVENVTISDEEELTLNFEAKSTKEILDALAILD